MTETDKEFVTRMAMYLVEGLDKEDFDRLFALLARRGADAADEIDRLRAALSLARPFIGWAGHYPTILAEIDAALKEDGDD